MIVQVKFFGNLVDVVGKDTLQLQNVTDTDTLLSRMISDFPQLGKCTFVIAVENKIITGNKLLREGDVVAFLPPFAGG